MSTSERNSPNFVSTLDVISLGLSVEMYEQLQISKGIMRNLDKSFLPTDIKNYPIFSEEKKLAYQQRCASTFSLGISKFVENWAIPTVWIWPSRSTTKMLNDELWANYCKERFYHLQQLAGMPNHRLSVLTPVFLDEPEDILECAFRFFEAYPDAPALLLFTTDGDITRQLVGDMSREAHWKDGPRRLGSMAETVVALLLARPERVDQYLRPYASTRATHLYPAGPAKPGFTPSKYLPEAWTAEQLDQFDALPTIAVLHRPLRFSYCKDKDDKAVVADSDTRQRADLMPPQQRQALFKQMLETVLPSIPGDKPDCILYDAGGPTTGNHVIPLAMAVHAALSEMDFDNPEEIIDLSQRIGNTGAASPFVLWALAALMSSDKKNTVMTVNLRQKEEATITVVTPAAQPTPQTRGQAPIVASSPQPASTHHPEPVRHAAIGTRARTEDECPQSGYWQCVPADVLAGDRHFIRAGQSFPPIRAKRELSMMEKMMNESPIEVKLANWTLVSYD